MTAWLGLVLALSGPKVVELPEAGTGQVVVDAVVRAPDTMSDREEAAWQVLGEALQDGTEEFSSDRLREYSSQAGVPLLIETWPDFIHLRIVEPRGAPDQQAGGLKLGFQILEALCRRATLTDEAVMGAVSRMKASRSEPWQEALDDLAPPFGTVSTEAVRSLYAAAFKPENVTVVVGGDLEAGQAQSESAARFAGWATAAVRRPRFDRAPRQRLVHSGPVTTYELRGTAFTLGQPDAPEKLLAVVALGVGKESMLHKVVREQLGLTYRQEAVLWPTAKGWVPRLLFARQDGDAGVLQQALEALFKDIDLLSEGDLVRARAMAQQALAGECPLGPFLVGGRAPMGSSLADRCDWAVFNAMSGSAAAPAFGECTLVKLKGGVRDLLERAEKSVIPGSAP